MRIRRYTSDANIKLIEKKIGKLQLNRKNKKICLKSALHI